MQPNISWLDDPRVFGVGRRDAHSDHAFYASQEDCRAQQDTLRQCLDGVWKFAYSINAKERPADFWQEDYDGSAFGEITVPGHIEMAGYDKIHYINTMYPWEGHEYRRGAYSLASAGGGAGISGSAGCVSLWSAGCSAPQCPGCGVERPVPGGDRPRR